MSLQKSFQKACQKVEEQTSKINQGTLLKLYSYYKQATKGNANGKRPGMANFIARAKFDGWASLTGMSTEEAKQNYVRMAGDLNISDSTPPHLHQEHKWSLTSRVSSLSRIVYQSLFEPE